MGILAFDTAGVLLGWRLLDHAAHLGGALSGMCVSNFFVLTYFKNKSVVFVIDKQYIP